MVDYSKWKDIEVSDDEDETHPNIDTPSLFRWRHQARIERMEEKKKEQEALQKEQEKCDEKLNILKKEMKTVEECSDEELQRQKKQELEKKMHDLKHDMEKIHLKKKELEKKERLEPWNVDTISSEGFDKSLINKDTKQDNSNLTEEEKEEQLRKFVKENEKLIKEYGMYRNYEDSRRFMQENTHLACEHTANYLVIWCINLELEEKFELMRHVAHQAICLQFVLELATQLERDPRSCVSAFFHRIQNPEPEYKRVFNDELEAFIARIERRAKEKIAAAEKEVEEEERQKRLGPGGLDPLEVLEELPAELKACFESQDIGQLKAVIAAMDPAEAAKHMKRCVASGLWVPEGGATTHTSPDTGLIKPDDDEEDDEEEIYEEVAEQPKTEEKPPVAKVEDTVD